MSLSSNPLLSHLQTDVTEWIEQSEHFFTNERDMQVKLAKYLESRIPLHYDLVDTEYRVPLAEMQARGFDVPTKDADSKDFVRFPWKNEISVDIIVGKDKQYALIELKYSTRELAEQPLIFGEKILSNSKILKNQAAGNLTMYNFWKDVRRIEAISETFDNVVGGIALLMSNSRDVWQKPQEGAYYTPFSTHNGACFKAGTHSWPQGVADSVLNQYPAFVTTGSYTCQWQETNIKERAKNNDPFRYVIINLNNN